MPCYVAGHRGAGARLDEPGRRDGRAHRRRQAARHCSAPRSRSATYLPRMATGEMRATMALTEPGGGSDLQAMAHHRAPSGRRRATSSTAPRPGSPTPAGRGLIALLCKTDPTATPKHKGICILLVEHGPGLTVSRDLPKLGYKGVESVRADLRRLPRAGRRAARRRARGAGSRR